MENPIQSWPPDGQLDPAEVIGLLPPALPEIDSLTNLLDKMPTEPPQIILGVLHKGCKLILGGTSKSNKSWSLLDMAVSVAGGIPWWGHETTRGHVLYINFELADWAIVRRLKTIITDPKGRQDAQGRQLSQFLDVWNLRGHAADISLLRPTIEEKLSAKQYSLIILDPAYKMLGDRDENANGEIGSMMNELERLCRATGAAIAIAHHFAKGNSADKSPIDRMSGAGAWARDPDAIIVLTPHETDGAFTASFILRNLPPKDEIVLRWQFPLMLKDETLDPDAIKRPQSANKKMTDSDFILTYLSPTPTAAKDILKATASAMSDRTCWNYLKRLTASGLISSTSTGYARK